MFDRPTVIVLGAGASADFGFPLGVQLREQIISGIGALRKQLDGPNFQRLSPTGDHNAHYFMKNPWSALASYISSPLAQSNLPEELQGGQIISKLFDFHDDFSGQTQNTVDEFVWANPKHEFIAKVLISQQIMLEMYEREDHQYRLKSFSDRDYGGRRNWYQHLINYLRDGKSDGDSVANNKLHVVTFNYDHSLEQALETSLANTEIHQGADYTKAVSIFHVNGTPPKLPTVVANAGQFILDCAQTFHLAQETAGSEVEEVRANARNAISKAERIYLMGFQFDPSNLSAIGLQGGLQNDGVFCLNFSGHMGLKQKILRLEIPESRILAGSRDRPLHINEALENGFLEQ